MVPSITYHKSMKWLWTFSAMAVCKTEFPRVCVTAILIFFNKITILYDELGWNRIWPTHLIAHTALTNGSLLSDRVVARTQRKMEDLILYDNNIFLKKLQSLVKRYSKNTYLKKFKLLNRYMVTNYNLLKYRRFRRKRKKMKIHKMTDSTKHANK